MIRSSVLLVGIFLLAGGIAWGMTAVRGSSADTAEAMVEAARAVLAPLDDAQRAAVRFSFEDEERYNWHYIPRERRGLPLKALTASQRRAVHALLRSGLSDQGYEKATNVIALEGVLGVLEGNPSGRDPENYYLSFFGEPSTEAPWGWRFEGHHLSLNFSSVTGRVVVATPAFLGANPAEVPSGERAGWRVLAAEEDLGRALLGLLDDEQRTRALLSAEAPGDIVTGAERTVRLQHFEGLPAAAMTSAQRDALLAIVRAYTHNMPPDVSENAWTDLERAGLDSLHFAWAGSDRRGEGHYYRVHGPTLLIEYDNTQNDANHVHTVWRTPGNDFGDDLLRRHYEESEHHR